MFPIFKMIYLVVHGINNDVVLKAMKPPKDSFKSAIIKPPKDSCKSAIILTK